MKKINPVDFYKFQNDEHSQYHADIRRLINANPAIKQLIEPLYPGYTTAHIAEENALQVERGSRKTKNIKQTNDLRRRMYRGFELLMQSCLIHYEPTIQEAARLVNLVMKQFDNPSLKNYSASSANITFLTDVLDANHSADVAAMGASEWLVKLKEANADFITRFGERSSEESVRISRNVRATRVFVDPAYNAIVIQINALVVINGEADFVEFIDEVNYIISKYKTTLAIRKGRLKKEKKGEEKVD